MNDIRTVCDNYGRHSLHRTQRLESSLERGGDRGVLGVLGAGTRDTFTLPKREMVCSR